jgi:MSHA pilin protein MshD
MREIRSKQHGFSLIELVVTIVLVGFLVSGALLLIDQTTRSSADPMITQQAVGIAQSYMEEIMGQAYSDPGGPAEAGRATFDDVDDYNGLNDNGGAVDRTGAAIPGLGAYNVSVAVTAEALNGVAAKRIDVTVTHDNLPALSIPLSAYRTDY